MASKLPPIAIIGAGLSGLTLGLSLRHKGIAAALYDKAAVSSRHNYAITLYPSTYRPLLKLLNLDEATFREKVAVRAQRGAAVGVSNAHSSQTDDHFRCNRGRLEALLSENLQITWNKRLESVELDSNAKLPCAVFEDGTKLASTCLIGCDGPHSIVRQSLTSTMNLRVLPYVVFNGKRRIPIEEYTDNYSLFLKDGLRLHKRTSSGALLEVSVNDITDSHVNLNYVYSRSAKLDNDSLHRPNRSNSSASDIPEELLNEINALQELESPFNEVFNATKVRSDRLLHWLMRYIEPDSQEVCRLSSHRVVLIGDAVHATPILGGEGANLAIKDGLDLAGFISSNGLDNLEKFSESRIEFWKDSVAQSKKKIEKMHAEGYY